MANKPKCARCGQEATITLRTGTVACSQACSMALIYALVASWSEDKAKRRYAEIMARCAPQAGKLGGLSAELADELQFVADRLRIRLVWQSYDFRTDSFQEGRGT